jgi:hypothetical protein
MTTSRMSERHYYVFLASWMGAPVVLAGVACAFLSQFEMPLSINVRANSLATMFLACIIWTMYGWGAWLVVIRPLRYCYLLIIMNRQQHHQEEQDLIKQFKEDLFSIAETSSSIVWLLPGVVFLISFVLSVIGAFVGKTVEWNIPLPDTTSGFMIVFIGFVIVGVTNYLANLSLWVAIHMKNAASIRSYLALPFAVIVVYEVTYLLSNNHVQALYVSAALSCMTFAYWMFITLLKIDVQQVVGIWKATWTDNSTSGQE